MGYLIFLSLDLGNCWPTLSLNRPFWEVIGPGFGPFAPGFGALAWPILAYFRGSLPEFGPIGAYLGGPYLDLVLFGGSLPRLGQLVPLLGAPAWIFGQFWSIFGDLCLDLGQLVSILGARTGFGPIRAFLGGSLPGFEPTGAYPRGPRLDLGQLAPILRTPAYLPPSSDNFGDLCQGQF